MSASEQSDSSIFSFSEFLAALALLLVVITISDFSYKLRLELSGADRKRAVVISGIAGLGILFTDFWFQNGWPVPFFLNSANNIKFVIGLAFLVFVLVSLWTAFVAPPKLSSSNIKRFSQIAYRTIGEGDPDKIRNLLSELQSSLPSIMKIRSSPFGPVDNAEEVPDDIRSADDLIQMLADPRVTNVIAQNAPWFAVDFMRSHHEHAAGDSRIASFLRNTALSFFKEKNSAIYLEHSKYDAGFMGYRKQISYTLFGDYQTIETCASIGYSPFDLRYRETRKFDEQQAEVFCSCAAIFYESYLKQNGGNTHSYAIARLFKELDSLVFDLHQLNERENIEWPNDIEGRLDSVVDFLRTAMKALEELSIQSKSKSERSQIYQKDPYDYIAQLMFNLILKTTEVKTPNFVHWSIQHNATWSRFFTHEFPRTESIVRKRLFRLMFDEIKKMDSFPNFKGARILAYCLNVLGLNPGERADKNSRSDYPLRYLASDWVRRNYRTLLTEHPHVATACLLGTIHYDSENHQLVKVYSGRLGKEPRKSMLNLV